MNLNERGQYSHRIDSGDESGKDETMEHLELDSAIQRSERETPQSQTYQNGVEKCVCDGEQENSADIVKERPINYVN